jgi:segregation and condensation protein B
MSEPVEPSLPSEANMAVRPEPFDVAQDRPVEGLDVVEVEHTVDTVQLKRILEAALLTTQEPLSIAELKRLSEIPLETKFLEELLQQLVDKYADSGVELNRVASGWRFRARPEMQAHLDKLDPQKPPRYSRAVLETLAIIAYRQPVTRGDIEDIRGVAVSSQVLKTLEARGWVESIGTRDTPGKPALYATTPQFMDDLNLRSLQELPALEEMGTLLEAGIVDEPANAEAETAESEPEPNAT